jgi:hypothetical protein
VRAAITERSKAASAIFGQESVSGYDGRTVTIGFPSKFHCERADRPAGRELIRSVLESELGVSGLEVRCKHTPQAEPEAVGEVSQAPLDLADPADGAVSEAAPPAKPAARAKAAASDPAAGTDAERFFQEVLEEMNATLVAE